MRTHCRICLPRASSGADYSKEHSRARASDHRRTAEQLRPGHPPRVPMGIYTIGNDGFTLCRETPTAVNEGEIVVASNEKLHADRLSGKRLLPLWTARLDVESRRMGG
jgi:hypothetical protein